MHGGVEVDNPKVEMQTVLAYLGLGNLQKSGTTPLAAVVLGRYTVSGTAHAEVRAYLSHGFSDLLIYVYFTRWTPKSAPIYSQRLDAWMKQAVRTAKQSA